MPIPPASLVLDTNTVLALWMFRDPALQVLRAWLEGDGCALYSREDALEEFRHVLAYPRFGLDESGQAALRADYLARATLVSRPEPLAALPTCRDPDDQKFLEIAAAAGTTCLLTRDKALLRLARHRLVRERFAIMTPECLSRALTECGPPPA
jgi:putative PIN family toxin of toxin-antitoxin system